ncbi:MAG: branched-chain amino acid ABC transporter permease [Myxococcales bacterium]|nr:branched-chain amino acid ABC transporter permease [Myxococcales bacterium]
MPAPALITRYEDDMALLPGAWHRLGALVGAFALLAYPFVVDAQWLTNGNLVLVTVVGALGMMLLMGLSGQLSLGHAAFLAIGAYTTAILAERTGMPFWLSMPIAGLSAAAVAIAIGPVALRLRGMHLALVTLGLLFVVSHTLHAAHAYTHGSLGMEVTPHGWFPSDGNNRHAAFSESSEWLGLEFTLERKLFLVFLPVTLLAALGAANLQRSNTGRAMMAERDREVAAAALGVHPGKARVMALGLSSFLAGVSGSMFAVQQRRIAIEPTFDLTVSVAYLAMVVLGGMGSVFGAIWGAVLFVALAPLATDLFEALAPVAPMFAGLGAPQQATLLSCLLAGAFLLFEPLGLVGLWLRAKRYLLAWPFRY